MKTVAAISIHSRRLATRGIVSRPKKGLKTVSGSAAGARASASLPLPDSANASSFHPVMVSGAVTGAAHPTASGPHSTSVQSHVSGKNFRVLTGSPSAAPAPFSAPGADAGAGAAIEGGWGAAMSGIAAGCGIATRSMTSNANW